MDDSEQVATDALMAALRGDLETLYNIAKSLKDSERVILSVAAERLANACWETM